MADAPQAIWVRVFFADTHRRGLTGTLDLAVLLESLGRDLYVEDVIASLSVEYKQDVGGIHDFDYQAFVTRAGFSEPAQPVEANFRLTGRFEHFDSIKIVTLMKDPTLAQK